MADLNIGQSVRHKDSGRVGKIVAYEPLPVLPRWFRVEWGGPSTVSLVEWHRPGELEPVLAVETAV